MIDAAVGGTVRFTAADTYTGGTTIQGGTLELANNSALGTNALAMSTGTTLRAGTASLSLGNGITLSGSDTIDSNGDALTMAGLIAGSGALTKIGAGTLTLTHADTYSGGTTLSAGTLALGSGGSLAGNVTFAGSAVTLLLATGASQLSGQIVGAIAGDQIDAAFASFAAGDHAVWQQTSSSGGTLSLFDNGTDLGSFNLAGSFNSLDFNLSKDGSSGALVTVQNTPSYAENAGNNDEWILSDGSWVESAGPGSHPSGYNVAGIGDWTGNGTDGILWFNPTTGDTDEWQLSNTQWSGSVDLGSHPGNYQISGVGDFNGDGTSDVLWTNTSGGSVQTDIWELASNGQWMASVSPGSHPAGYTVAGTGDWTGDGTDGILWYNASTGDTDEWQLSGGQWAASVDLGSHPGNFQIAGIGDFNGDGTSDVLWTATNADGTIATDIWELSSTGQWMASVSPGSHPAGYQVAAVGDFTGTGTSDILWYDPTTGGTDEWLINNGQWAGSINLGSHPGNFQIAGAGDFNGDGIAGVLWHSPS